MILKILRLTLHSGAPMHRDAAKLRGLFATSYSEHALLHQHVKEHKGKKSQIDKDYATSGIKYHYS